MSRINFSNLPVIIYMEDLSTALGLKGSLDVGTVNQIILASKCNNLPIYFDDAMHGAVCDDTHGIEDENGEIIEIIANGVDIEPGRKTLLHGLTYQDVIAVDKFKYKSTEYYSVNKYADCLELRKLYVGRFYCDREELQASGLLPINKSKPKNPTRPKRLTKLKQREAVFRNWLATKANIKVTKTNVLKESNK